MHCVTEQKAKDKKAERKAMKAAKTVVDETPDETEEFLREKGVTQDPPSLTTSNLVSYLM
jgi:hypothetical protein